MMQPVSGLYPQPLVNDPAVNARTFFQCLAATRSFIELLSARRSHDNELCVRRDRLSTDSTDDLARSATKPASTAGCRCWRLPIGSEPRPLGARPVLCRARPTRSSGTW